jgi:hypothetical protein
MTPTDTTPRIGLLGDLAMHTMIVRESRTESGRAVQRFRAYRRLASQPLLVDMIRAALKDEKSTDFQCEFWPSYTSDKCDLKEGLGSLCGELVAVSDSFAEGSASRKPPHDTLRIKASYLLTASADKGNHDAFQELCRKSMADLLNELPRAPECKDLLVLYDHGSFFRTALAAIDLAAFQRHAEAATGGIVIGLNSDLTQLEWLSKAMPKVKGDENSFVCRERTVVLVTADGLRKAGLPITKYGALEKTVADIFDKCNTTPLKELLDLAAHVVVSFSETGGLVLDRSTGTLKASLHYCPNFDRIGQSDPRTYGGMPGKFSIFLVALVKALFQATLNQREADIDAAVRLAAVAFNHLFTIGLGKTRKSDETAFDPFGNLVEALSADTCTHLTSRVNNPDKRELLVSSLKFQAGDQKNLSRSAAITDLVDEELTAKLRDLVIKGLDAALLLPTTKQTSALTLSQPTSWFPSPCIEVPYAAMGNLRLLDPKEIESHYSLAKVMRKYIESPDWKTPLSIAVFGGPGSGKSFGVKQILKSVDPGRQGEPLNFNLAQFDSLEQLTEAFHQIQDRALASAEVPLAIFDEFDAVFLTRLGWLKYFLAPMQDGVFRGRTGEYKIGRAIFLFAGGTSHSFAEFRQPLTSVAKESVAPPIESAKTLSQDDVRAFKLADFTSRLRGTLDITPINDEKDQQARCVTASTQLKRAVVLRSMLEEHAKPIFVYSHKDRCSLARIDPTVIDAFLRHREFTNGVRSIEAIIQMSRWIGGEFVPASLPAPDLMLAHTGDEKFLKA